MDEPWEPCSKRNEPVTKGHTLHDPTCRRCLEQSHSKTVSNGSRQGLGGGANRELPFNRYRTAVLQDEKVLESG